MRSASDGVDYVLEYTIGCVYRLIFSRPVLAYDRLRVAVVFPSRLGVRKGLSHVRATTRCVSFGGLLSPGIDRECRSAISRPTRLATDIFCRIKRNDG